MNRATVTTEFAPKAIGPYSQAIVANGFVFCSGQIALDPETGSLVEGDITAQMRQVLKNVGAVLEAAGATFETVVKTTVFLHKMEDFQAMNKVYGEVFGESPPARTTVGNLELPRGALVEIEVVAVIP